MQMNKVLNRDIYVNITKKYEIDSASVNFQDSDLKIPEDDCGCRQLNLSVLAR